jgi:hypothetical protein
MTGKRDRGRGAARDRRHGPLHNGHSGPAVVTATADPERGGQAQLGVITQT